MGLYLMGLLYSFMSFKPTCIMKTLYLACMAAVLGLGCQQAETGTETAAPATSVPAPAEFAYTIEQPADNWSPGDLRHVVTALNSLKGFENGDIAASMAGFADSVLLEVDEFEAKIPKDTLAAMFAASRGRLASMKIVMNDWESVISKDKKTEIVSLWFKEIRTDKAGKTDSVEMMADLRMENGKIASLNEKTRRYAVKK